MRWRFRHSPDGDQSPVSTFAALLLVAFVAAGCVLWFMSVAMRNERLAVQQRLSDVYLNHLVSVQRQLTAFWKERQAALLSAVGDTPAEIFATTIRSNLADSVIIYDRSGVVAYPSALPANSASQADEPKGWDAARELEFQKTNYLAAAEAYERLAESHADVHLKARALQAQGGCLLKAGQKESALKVLVELTRDSALRKAISPQGALLIPNVQLLMLKAIQLPSDPLFQHTLTDLAGRLNDYSEPEFSASQRRFLMEELTALFPADAVFPTLPAEQLAAEFLELQPAVQPEARLQRSPMPKIWRLSSLDRRRVALFREEGLRGSMNSLVAALSLPDVRVVLFAPGETPPPSTPLPAQEAGDLLPGWRLTLQFQGADPFLAASTRQTRFYLWTGFLGVLIIGALAFLVARFVTAQMRLARLKNDLVSTVSHELKTPLASMRALVDTLSARRYRGEEQLEDYLRLVSKENQRLSHLIENFLAFSRLERGKQRFRLEDLQPQSIVDDAVGALRDKLESPNCVFEAQVERNLPLVRGDSDALTTVLINLLDNACKYTETEKRIRLRTYPKGRQVCFEVKDNGVGLSRGEVRRIFDRFYQVDQTLTRKRSGCGLGLSIVRSIVQAHGGSVEVESEPGQGSTFTVRLPARDGIGG